jgi:hypothetical protein
MTTLEIQEVAKKLLDKYNVSILEVRRTPEGTFGGCPSVRLFIGDGRYCEYVSWHYWDIYGDNMSFNYVLKDGESEYYSQPVLSLNINGPKTEKFIELNLTAARLMRSLPTFEIGVY